MLLDDHCGWVRSLAMAGGRWLFSCACNTLRQVRAAAGGLLDASVAACRTVWEGPSGWLVENDCGGRACGGLQ